MTQLNWGFSIAAGICIGTVIAILLSWRIRARYLEAQEEYLYAVEQLEDSKAIYNSLIKDQEEASREAIKLYVKEKAENVQKKTTSRPTKKSVAKRPIDSNQRSQGRTSENSVSVSEQEHEKTTVESGRDGDSEK